MLIVWEMYGKQPPVEAAISNIPIERSTYSQHIAVYSAESPCTAFHNNNLHPNNSVCTTYLFGCLCSPSWSALYHSLVEFSVRMTDLRQMNIMKRSSNNCKRKIPTAVKSWPIRLIIFIFFLWISLICILEILDRAVNLDGFFSVYFIRAIQYYLHWWIHKKRIHVKNMPPQLNQLATFDDHNTN